MKQGTEREFCYDCGNFEGHTPECVHGVPAMQMFRNMNFTERDYECTNIVSCLAPSVPQDGIEWTPTTHEELNAMLRSPVRSLYIQAGVQYYGYL